MRQTINIMRVTDIPTRIATSRRIRGLSQTRGKIPWAWIARVMEPLDRTAKRWPPVWRPRHTVGEAWLSEAAVLGQLDLEQYEFNEHAGEGRVAPSVVDMIRPEVYSLLVMSPKARILYKDRYGLPMAERKSRYWVGLGTHRADEPVLDQSRPGSRTVSIFEVIQPLGLYTDAERVDLEFILKLSSRGVTQLTQLSNGTRLASDGALESTLPMHLRNNMIRDPW